MLEKIGKLLAAAEGAKTQAEAEAFFEKAQALASVHAITLAEAAMFSESKQKRETPIRETVTVGKSGAHVNRHLVWLMSGIAAANDVKMNIAYNSTFVVLFGMPSDIEVCKLLWTNIATQMVRLGDGYIREGSWRGETVYRPKRVKTYWGWDEEWANRPITAQSARASYYQGFTNSVGERLSAQRAKAVKEREEHWHETADVQAENVTTSDDGKSLSRTALAIREKELAVKEFYDEKSDARGSWKGRGSTSFSSSGYSRGAKDGSNVNLSGAKSVSGAKARIGA